jgi:hypothetical protein
VNYLACFTVTGAVLGTLVLGASLSVSCVTDQRENEQVNVISSCDLTALDTTPSSPQATVKVFVEAAEGLAQAATMNSTQLQDLCNSIDMDLGLAPGTDLPSSCGPIVKREESIKNVAGSTVTGWFGITYQPTCTTDPNAKAACIATCAGPCDVSKCAPGMLQGACPGNCSGQCVITGAATTCSGACEGACNNESNVCTGECIGSCSSGSYTAYCETGCCSTFVGHCDGTCTGTCDKNPINIIDAGQDSGGGDSGADTGSDASDSGADGAGDSAPSDSGCGDGLADAACPESGPPSDSGPPADAGPPPIPCLSNADGNCPGVCVGACSSKASGSCKAKCTGKFMSGVCASPSTCNGQCISGAGAGCAQSAPSSDAGGPPPATTCDGLCVEAIADGGSACSGICQGTCDQPLQNATCTGALQCNQNQLCDYACSVKGALATMCTPPDAIEVEAVSDPVLYAELKTHGPQLAQVIQQIQALRVAEGLIAQQTVADFQAIDAGGDLVRACVARGNTAANQAQTALTALAEADITVFH